jgi:AraC family transcriptional regulator of adaptative response/methylated-DNA-[protein]-cysteine methyltransferase
MIPNVKKAIICSLKASLLDTPLGPMIAIASEAELYLLDFLDRRGFEREIERLRQRTKAVVLPGETAPIQSIRAELEAYFSGQLTQFKTPLCLLGSPFQQQVWRALQSIPFGGAWSYRELAVNIGRPLSCRAVANANGANPLSIVIPCHRVINTGGALGGYGGGVARKQWLLNHELAFRQRASNLA